MWIWKSLFKVSKLVFPIYFVWVPVNCHPLVWWKGKEKMLSWMLQNNASDTFMKGKTASGLIFVSDSNDWLRFFKNFYFVFARVTGAFNAVVELVLWETWDLFLCVGGSNSKSISLVGTGHLHILCIYFLVLCQAVHFYIWDVGVYVPYFVSNMSANSLLILVPVIFHKLLK